MAEGGGAVGQARAPYSVRSPPPPPPAPRHWSWNPWQPQSHYQETIKQLENAAMAAYQSALADGGGVTVAAVLSRMLRQLGIYTLESIGVQASQIPCLRTLSAIEGKANAYIVAYVAGNRIATLHDLVLGLCEDERVDSFDDLGLGPVTKNTLIQQLFGPGLVEVYKLTALDVLQDLNKLMEKKNHVDPAALLAFVAEERSIDAKRLGVRIQSLGMYIGISREVKRKERETLQRWEANMRKAREKREAIQRGLRDTKVTEAETQKAYPRPSHIRFSYSDSDSDDNKAVPPRHSSCPFPSSREERDKSFVEAASEDLSLAESAVSIFVENWKRCCYELPVTEVLKRMLKQVSSEKFLRKLVKFFKSRPILTLLNIAVASMKNRFNPSTLDVDATLPSSSAEVEAAFQSVSGFDFRISRESIVESVASWGDACRKCSVSKAINHIVAGTRASRKSRYFKLYPVVQILNIAMASINSGEWDGGAKLVPDAEDVVALTEAPSTCTGTDDEVLSTIKQHFELYVSASQAQGKGWENVLKCLVDCEKLIFSSFSDKVFSGLGFKSFLSYLEFHIEKLTPPTNINNSEAVPRHRIEAFVRQASNASTGLSKEDLATLCCKQFGLARASIEELVLNDKSQAASTVYFSAALLGNYLLDSGAKVGKLGSKTDADAEACLAKAPILTDLAIWSQWSSVYEPQLGPLLDWLEQDRRRNRQLLSLVTRAGKLLRVDADASADRFFEAVVDGRSIDVAAELVSLSVLYGGAAKTPKELLQTHVTKGIQIYWDRTRLKTSRKRKQQAEHHEATSFILDCIVSIPEDFIEFAAELIYTPFKRVFPDAAALLLRSCGTAAAHRLLLHQMGLAAGIPEWINDYTNFGCSIQADRICRDPEYDSEIKHKKLKIDQSASAQVQPDASAITKKQQFAKEEIVHVSDGNYDSDAREAREIVRMIRKEEFGLGEHQEAVQSGLLAKQHARMGRALECLSQNLYSEDCHFILELVQNADDNAYLPRAHPTLAFVIRKDRIVVLNNEQGFTAKNIRALCDVGKSTKKGQASDYIGHKGIGFKSVFRVTESPEIHSNGFHVKFDISESSIGFILPTWVPAPRDNAYFENLISDATAEATTGSINTRIDLPLRAAVAESDAMSRMFQDLQPKLLLFLHKLQTLVVKNEVSDSCWTMRRRDVGNNIVKLSDGSGTGTFLVVRQLLDAAIDRAGVPDTELALAFELREIDGDGGGEHYAAVPAQQEVFAFLPVRSYGLKFVVQGDFILPSSREDLDRDSAWNQWLRSEIPKLFVEALDCFESSSVFGSRIEAVSSYLSYVPLEGEVLGFFASIPTMILSLLRSAQCLPVEGSEIRSRPCSALRGWNDAIRMLVPDEMLKKYLGLVYLNREVIIGDVLASSLGISDYGVDTLVSLLKAVAGSLEELGISWLRRCLLEMHSCIAVEKRKKSRLRYQQQEQDLAESLRSVRFVPVSSGGFTSVQDGPVWFLDAESMNNPKNFIDLYSDIRTVSPDLIDEIDIEDNVVIKEMLTKLGIKVVTAHEVIKSHILPAMASGDCCGKDPKLVAQYLGYCGLHFEIDKCRSCEVERDGFVSRLKNTAVVLTRDGLRNVAEGNIHFGVDLGNTIDVEKILEGLSVRRIEVDARKYLQMNPSPGIWRKFFSDLGVCDFINVIPSKLRIEDRSSTVWKNENWSGSRSGSGENSAWIVQDWSCENSIQICSALARGGSPSSGKQFLAALDDLWDEHYDRYSKCSYSVDGAAEIAGECDSSFVLQLREYAWIESSLDGQLHKPVDLFERSSVEPILGNYASYANPQVKSGKLARALGLKSEVRLEDIYDLFKLLIERSKQGSLSISIAQMERIYTFLSEKLDSAALRQVFCDSSYIFLPSVRGARSNDDVSGNLYSASDLTWSDPFGLDDSAAAPLRTLCSVYSAGMREFFVEGCRVSEAPDFDTYIIMLQHIAKTMPPSKILDKVLELFSFWSREFEAGKMTPEEIARRRDAFRTSCAPILPTTENNWIVLTDANTIVCWCDDAELADNFDYLNTAVKFVDVGSSSSSILSFLAGIGVPRFSELVEREAIVYGPTASPDLENVIRLVLPYGQRYLMQHHPESYDRCKERLLEFQCFVVETLFFRYKLKSTRLSSRNRSPCSCLLQDNKLYVSSSHVEDYACIFLELSRLFFSGNQQMPLANFLHLIALQARNLANDSLLESIVASSQGLMRLPAEETPWILLENQNEMPGTSAMASRADEFLDRQRRKRDRGRNLADAPPAQKQNVIDLDDYEFSEQQADDTREIRAVDREKMMLSRPANREQQGVTGRNGEKMVYEHLCRKYGEDASVSWVNQDVESGWAYDIVVDLPDGRRKFVEVKSTRSSSKDWFEVSPSEWEFATKMGDKYSIIRIQMLENRQQARLVVFDNPAQLCRDKVLQLALICLNY